MRGPYRHPHHGETRDLRLARRQRGGNVTWKDHVQATGIAQDPILCGLLTPEATDAAPRIMPVDPREVSRNPLRPTSLDTMVGQERLKPLLRRLIDNSVRLDRPLDHILLVGASGTGKTTVSLVIACELGRRAYVLKAPVDMETLSALADSGQDGDIVFIDEIHLQVQGDRRGITQAVDPENFYTLLEDFTLMGPRGPRPFPHVTVIGATTDVGLLPEPLSNRFPLQPRLLPYTREQMVQLAHANLEALGLTFEGDVPTLLGDACRLNPRQLNSYVRSARSLAGDQIDAQTAREVVTDLNGSTLDGLTPSMQICLRYLYKSCRKEFAGGRVQYACSVNQLATACGHGRDTKAVSLLVEPWLIQEGYLSVQHGGRTLTDKGIQRAKELLA